MRRRGRRVLVVGVVALGMWRPVSSADAAAAGPSIPSLRVAPTSLSAPGGKVQVIASVRGAERCTLSAVPAVPGLPETMPCAGSIVSRSVVVPVNTTSTKRTYTFRLVARGPGGATASRSTAIVVAASPPGARYFTGSLTLTVRRSSPGTSLNVAFDYQATTVLSLDFNGIGTGQWKQTPIRKTPISGSYATTTNAENSRLCSATRPGAGALGGTYSYYLWPNVTDERVTVNLAVTGATLSPHWSTVCGLPQDQEANLTTPVRDISAGNFTFPGQGGQITRSGAVPACRSAVCTYRLTATLKRVR